MVAVGKIEMASSDSEDGVVLDPKLADAWAIALADMLWKDPVIQERMSAQFQKVVDKMVEVSFRASA
jgi:hypothetical protein